MTARSDRADKIWSIVRVSSGNFLEMYDFFVFGYYASAIGKVFFPTGSEFAQLMLAFMTFGAGFLMRPLGAVVLGSYIDHHGRRAGLLLTLMLRLPYRSDDLHAAQIDDRDRGVRAAQEVRESSKSARNPGRACGEPADRHRRHAD